MIGALFCGRAQVIVGCLFLAATAVQSWYWLIVSKPNATAIFIVSMEALAFAAYAVIGTGLGMRATERVEQHVTPGDN